MKNNVIVPLILGLALVGVVGYGIASRQSTPEPTATSIALTNASYPCESGKTAYELLAAKYQVTAKDTSFGKQVTGIGGTEATGNQYWAFYVDGALASVGADAYTCAGSEPVEWKLESF